MLPGLIPKVGSTALLLPGPRGTALGADLVDSPECTGFAGAGWQQQQFHESVFRQLAKYIVTYINGKL